MYEWRKNIGVNEKVACLGLRVSKTARVGLRPMTFSCWGEGLTMNDSIKGVVEGKCPECGWERKVSSLTPPTATLFCKECDYQGASELWTTNAQAQSDRLPEEQLWELVKERVNSINNASNQSTSLRSQRKREPSDIELLREIAKHSEESARHLFFIRIGIAVIVFVLLGGFTFTFR